MLISAEDVWISRNRRRLDACDEWYLPFKRYIWEYSRHWLISDPWNFRYLLEVNKWCRFQRARMYALAGCHDVTLVWLPSHFAAFRIAKCHSPHYYKSPWICPLTHQWLWSQKVYAWLDCFIGASKLGPTTIDDSTEYALNYESTIIFELEISTNLSEAAFEKSQGWVSWRRSWPRA